MTSPGIEDYAVIGDGRSAALVSREGSIDWLCWPRFDSPSCLAALLDADAGGRWQIAPRVLSSVTRRYAGHSNVLVTTFETESGRMRLTDLMPVCSEEEKKHRLLPEHEILRIVECDAGEVEVQVRFDLRLDYGRRRPRWRAAGGLGLRVEDGAEIYTLRGDAPLTLQADGAVVANVRLQRGARLHFSLTYDSDGPAVLPPLGEYSMTAVRSTIAWWESWAARCTYQGRYREQVLRRLLTLKLMSFAPTGAMVAAPTTSLPERTGSDLNWDYRYCWLRDASLTVRALFDLGYAEDAAAFVSWLLHTTTLTRPELRVLYDVYGRPPGKEEVLSHLDGFKASRPVRLGNAAASQLQLDAYGEVIDAVTCMVRRGVRLDRTTQAMLRQLAEYVCENWWRADEGIWEPREAPQMHTHSRLLCWTAAERLLELGRRNALEGLDVPRLEDVSDRTRADIEVHGWNAALRTYTQVLDGDTVDASLLLMSWYGFVAPDSARLRLTYERIQERLGVGPGLIYRYEQSRDAGEGAFGICCFWAAQYLAAGGGTLEEAQACFEQLLRYANDLGLYAEEIDASSQTLLGNFPQAFTHVGLISAALALEERRAKQAPALDVRAEPLVDERPREEVRP